MSEASAEPIARTTRPSGSALFARGFRPFFLGAGAMALLGIVGWLLVLGGQQPLSSPLDLLAWHSHEMLFGMLGAALAGFLLTAVPNWTGRPPLAGMRLFGLFILWLAGRLLLAFGKPVGLPASAGVDLFFWLLLTGLIAREVAAGRNWRNLPVVIGLGLFTLADGLFHAAALDLLATTGPGWRLGVATLALLIALIGGRIVPAFTASWLASRGELPPPPGCRRLQTLALATIAAALGAWCWAPETPAAGALLLAAGLLLAWRMRQWQGWRTRREPLVWMLHAGYAWLVLGLLLAGAASLAPDWVPPSAALHALTAGAMGTMTMAVMTRAMLGHTGRDLTAGRATLLLYALLLAAGLLRVLAAWPGDLQSPLLAIAGGAWIAAFGLFLGVYGPMALRPRADGRPG